VGYSRVTVEHHQAEMDQFYHKDGLHAQQQSRKCT
jgi:hypothetical protein